MFDVWHTVALNNSSWHSFFPCAVLFRFFGIEICFEGERETGDVHPPSRPSFVTECGVQSVCAVLSTRFTFHHLPPFLSPPYKDISPYLAAVDPLLDVNAIRGTAMSE